MVQHFFPFAGRSPELRAPLIVPPLENLHDISVCNISYSAVTSMYSLLTNGNHFHLTVETMEEMQGIFEVRSFNGHPSSYQAEYLLEYSDGL